MKKYLCICWCMILLAACKSSSTDNGDLLIIPVNVSENSPVKLSEIADNIQKIELETSDDCLIQAIRQVICVDDRIVVYDLQRPGGVIHVFNLSGKFLFGINKYGQGPGEYLGIFGGITIDTENRHIIIGALYKILRYDLDDGHFIDEFPTDTNTTPIYIHFENALIYAIKNVIDRPSDIEGYYANTVVMSMYGRDWQLMDTMVVKTRILDRIMVNAPPPFGIISHDSQNNMYVYYPVMFANESVSSPMPPVNELHYAPHDTLYVLDGNRLKPYAKLKFSNDNPSKPNKNISYIWRTSNWLIAKYRNFSDDEGKAKYFCYDFNNKTGRNMTGEFTGGFIDDVYDTGLTEISPLNNQNFYYIKTVKDIPAKAEEPNPVLYIGKFKE